METASPNHPAAAPVRPPAGGARGRLRPTSQHRRFASGRSVLALILREMTTTYGRNPGGYLWAILEPVAGIALLSLVFSLMFRSPALGNNFPIFYATGVLPFLAYVTLSERVSQALTFSRSLLAYPSVTFVDAVLARFILNYLTQILVAYVVFAGILIIFETRTSVDLPAIALSLAMAGALGLGVGIINCFLKGIFPVWIRFWAILNRPMFIISGIFFVYESIPEPYKSWLWYNPLIHVVGQMRHGFYSYYEAPYVSPAYVFGLSLVLMVVGLVFLTRYYREILNK